ncbi:MAG: DUF4214 domain-containing protein [Saccharofermentans sp.]|nr:DUF4214 domain-containing protein [Saccharofermentans sp.]
MHHFRLRKTISTVLAVTLATSIFAFNSTIVSANDDTEIILNSVPLEEKYIPDAAFRAYLKKNVDKNGNDILEASEISNTTSITITSSSSTSAYYGLEDLKGIGYFKNITSLTLSGLVNVDSLDLSGNTKLNQVSITRLTSLESLKLGSLPSLSKLGVYNTGSLASIDVSGCPIINRTFWDGQKSDGLTQHYLDNANNGSFLSCDPSTQVIGGDFVPKAGMVPLDGTVFANDSMRRDLFAQKDLDHDGYLSTSECEAVTLLSMKCSEEGPGDTLKFFPNLTKLYINNQGITDIDVSNNPALKELRLLGNKLTKLDLSNNAELAYAYRHGTHRVESTYDSYTYKDVTLWIDFGVEVIAPDEVTPEPETPTPTPVTPSPEAPKPDTGVYGFCERLYTCALGRSSEPAGVKSWVDAINGGADGAQAARGFFFSDEFKNKNLDDSEYVTRLYKTFMDREPDAAGLKAWVDALDGGASREKVFDGFINSQEWANVCFKYGIKSGGSASPSIRLEPSAEILAFAERLYTICLGRPADASGLKAWAEALANREGSGAKVAHGFFFSEEFVGKDYDNGEFVRRCYLTFMDREPDAGGYAAWVEALDKGATREQVFNGLVKSPEFVALCEKAGIIAFG